MNKQEKQHYLHETAAMPDKNFLVNSFYYKRDIAGPFVPPHWHENIEFVYIESGSLKVHCNDACFMGEAGDVLIINSNEHHDYECMAVPLCFYCVVTDISVLNSRFFDTCEVKYIQPMLHNQILFENHIQQPVDVSLYIKAITDEFLGKEYGYELAMKANLYHLLATLLRDHTKKNLYLGRASSSSHYLKMNSILEYIENNYTEKITIDEMADMLGFSKYYFCKLFKQLNGRTFSEYINHLRINEAINLFHDTDMTITDIALTVGFNDTNYFSRTFKNITGISPSKVRKNLHLTSGKE